MAWPNQNIGNKLMDWVMNENDRKLIEFIQSIIVAVN